MGRGGTRAKSERDAHAEKNTHADTCDPASVGELASYERYGTRDKGDTGGARSRGSLVKAA